MEEKQGSKSRTQLSMRNKLDSQFKRIGELQKSGDIPWFRVQSAYLMCQQTALREFPNQAQLYPFKSLFELCEILVDMLQHSQQKQTFAPTISQPQKMQFQLQNASGETSPAQGFLSGSLIGSLISGVQAIGVIGIHQMIREQSLVQKELKKVIESLDASKQAIDSDITKGHNNCLEETNSVPQRQEVGEMIDSWRAGVTGKYKELNKKISDNKNTYQRILQKKDIEICKAKIDTQNSHVSKSHVATQTVDSERQVQFLLKNKQKELNLEKEKFLKATTAHKEEVTQLIKYSDSLKTSTHTKLEQCEHTILGLNSQISHLKTLIKHYVEENKDAQFNLITTFQRYQKAKTPFIPKAQIQKIYETMKLNMIKQQTLAKMVIEGQESILHSSYMKLRRRLIHETAESNPSLQVQKHSPDTNSLHPPKPSTIPRSSKMSASGGGPKHQLLDLNRSLASESLPLLKTKQRPQRYF